MQFLIGIVSSFIGGFIEWLVKKISIGKLAFLAVIGVVSLIITAFFTLFYFALDFILNFWNLLKDAFNSLPEISGDPDIISNFWGLIHASGLDTAFSVSLDLFFTILSAWIIIKLSTFFFYISKNVLDLVIKSFSIIK